MAKIGVPPRPTEDEFNRFLLKIIGDNLVQVIGKPATDMVFLFFDRKNGWGKEDIPENIEEFVAGLHDLLGTGAASLERLLLKAVRSNLKIGSSPESDVGFAEYVKRLRAQYRNNPMSPKGR